MTEQSKAPASSGPSHDAPIGTVHTWTDGKSYVKTANGWIPKPTGGDAAGGEQALGNTPEKNPVFFVDLTGLAKNPEARALAERQIRVVDQVADSMRIAFKTPPKVVAGPRMDGAGGAVHAQFTPGADKKPSEIKIFQSKELGASFARETGHAVDHALSQHGVSRIEEVLSGGADVDPKIKDAYENIVKEAQALYGKHLTPPECFARAFEVAVAAGAEKLTAEGRMKQGLHDPSGFSDTFSKPADPEHAKKVSEAERKMKDSYRAAQEAGTGTEEHQKFLDERDAHVAAKKDSAASRALPPEEQKRLKTAMLQHVLRVVRHQQFQKSFEELDTLEKALRPPFYVGVVVVCEGKFLCGKRREDGIWTGPGGGAKHGESPSQAAVRETLEETNLHLKEKDLLELPTLMTNNGRPVHCFLAYMRKHDTASLSEGIHSKNDPDKEVRSWGWYPIERGFPGNSDPNRHAALLAARVRLRSVRKSQVESFEDLLKSDVSGAISADSTHATEESQTEASLSDFQAIFLDRLRQEVGAGPLNQPVEIPVKELNVLTVWKVDDGIYSGHVKGPDGDILVQVERLTGVGLAGMLLSKELLMTEQEWNRMMLDVPPEQVEEPEEEEEEAPAPPSDRLKALEILAEALENFKGDLHIHL